MIQVPFSGALTYFLDCLRYFSAKNKVKRRQSLSSANRIMTYVAEDKSKGFLSLCVRRRFDYSDSYWPLLRDVEFKPAWLKHYLDDFLASLHRYHC